MKLAYNCLRIVAAGCAAWALGSWAACADADRIRLCLREEARVSADFLRLDQIVERAGILPGGACASSIRLGRVPPANAERLIERAEIGVRLTQCGVDPRRIEWAGPPVCKVRRGEDPRASKGSKWVAARDLPLGHLLAAGDLRPVPLLPGEKPFEPPPERWAGRQLDRALSEGARLEEGALRSPLCVRKGEWVRVTSGRRGVRLSFQAKATQEGRLGDRIRVESAKTPGVQLPAILTGAGEAAMADEGED